MALSHQATTINTSTADRSSANFAHNSGSGSNRVLLVTTKTLTATGDISVSSITYNGVALTFIHGISREYTTARYLRAEQWYLVAPATGSNTLAVTYSGNARADEITVTTLNGGHQSDTVGASNTAQGDSNNPSVTLTTETNNSWVMFGTHGRGGDLDPSTPGTGLTELTDGDTGASTSDDISYTDGYKVTTTAGAYTVNSTFSASDQWVASAVEIKEASSGLSATVNQASETDTAQTIGRLKTAVIGQNAETDTAQTVTKLKTLAVAQVTETDTAQAITRIKVLAIGLVTESDVSQAITALKTAVIGQVSETDTAQPITVFTGVMVGQVTETDTALPMTARKTAVIGMATESDTALPVAPLKVVAIGIVSETDTAQAIARLKTLGMGLVTETDTALGITAVVDSGIVGATVGLSDSALWVVLVGDSNLYSVILGDAALYEVSAQDDER